MTLQPAFDPAVPSVALALGIPAFFIVFIFFSLLETYMLIRVDKDTLRNEFGLSVLMNAISTVASFLLLLTLYDIWLSLVLSYLLSVLIEGLVVILLRRPGLRRSLLAVLAANSVSYMFLGVFMVIGGL